MRIILKGMLKSFFKREKIDKEQLPIDFVVTWVDGNDPAWKAERAETMRQYHGNAKGNESGRYQDWESFRYWFRAVEKYAPWVRFVHLVTWGHVPEWLNQMSSKLKIVKHREFIPSEYLPTFNSIAIEMNLFRIPELSENFVYFNDDVLLCRPVNPEEFFVNGKPKHCSRIVKHVKREQGVEYRVIYNTYDVVNEKNSIRKCMEKNPEKWFTYINRRGVLNNYEAWKADEFSGVWFTHMGVPFCRSTMQKTWEKYKDECIRTCECRFRDVQQIMHQLFSIEDMLNGYFEPSVCDWGTCVRIEDSESIARAYESGATKMICLFDGGNYTEQDIDRINSGLVAALNRFLPEKSSFEI